MQALRSSSKCRRRGKSLATRRVVNSTTWQKRCTIIRVPTQRRGRRTRKADPTAMGSEASQAAAHRISTATSRARKTSTVSIRSSTVSSGRIKRTGATQRPSLTKSPTFTALTRRIAHVMTTMRTLNKPTSGRAAPMPTNTVDMMTRERRTRMTVQNGTIKKLAKSSLKPRRIRSNSTLTSRKIRTMLATRRLSGVNSKRVGIRCRLMRNADTRGRRNTVPTSLRKIRTCIGAIEACSSAT